MPVPDLLLPDNVSLGLIIKYQLSSCEWLVSKWMTSRNRRIYILIIPAVVDGSARHLGCSEPSVTFLKLESFSSKAVPDSNKCQFWKLWLPFRAF